MYVAHCRCGGSASRPSPLIPEMNKSAANVWWFPPFLDAGGSSSADGLGPAPCLFGPTFQLFNPDPSLPPAEGVVLGETGAPTGGHLLQRIFQESRPGRRPRPPPRQGPGQEEEEAQEEVQIQVQIQIKVQI